MCRMADDSSPSFVDLHAAARGGDLEALGARVAAGDDVHGRDKHKRTALHMAAWAGQVRVFIFCMIFRMMYVECDDSLRTSTDKP